MRKSRGGGRSMDIGIDTRLVEKPRIKEVVRILKIVYLV